MKRKSYIAILAAIAMLSGCASQNVESVGGAPDSGVVSDSVSSVGDSSAAADGEKSAAEGGGMEHKPSASKPDSSTGTSPEPDKSSDSGEPDMSDKDTSVTPAASPDTSDRGESSKPYEPSKPDDISVPPETSAPSKTESTTAATAATASTTVPSTASTTTPHSDPIGDEYKGTDIGGFKSEDFIYGTAEPGDLFDGVMEEAAEFAPEFDMAGGAIAEAATTAKPSAAAPDLCPIPDPCPPYIEPQIPPAAGLLTGGEWKDNDNWEFWQDLYSSQNYNEDWSSYKKTWRTGADHRLEVIVKDSAGNLVSGAKVSSDMPDYSAVTDNEGKAYLFYSEDKIINGPSEITVSFGDITQTGDVMMQGTDSSIEISLEKETEPAEKTLDFMIMCDTTGSMWDELDYLKAELKDVVTRIKNENSNIPTRLSVNFYRDEGDEYVVREFPFTPDLDAAVNAISQQSANGGGDTPEAVHTALESAINSHDWDENSVKIMFLVLDAPPHDDIQIIDQTVKLVKQAAEKGIRIIPVASSGIDKSCEYLLRSMAFMTGGTYTFLTDDSGIGYGHIEPTIGSYDVEKLNDMMVRITGEYLK